MNKLLLGALIVLIFVSIVFLPYYNSSTSSSKENFQSNIRVYPDTAMEEHENYIQSHSNDYSLINNLIDTLSDEVSDKINLTGLNNISHYQIKILDEIMKQADIKFRSLVDSNVNCSGTTKRADCAILISLIQFLNNKYSRIIPSNTLNNNNYRTALNIPSGNNYSPSAYDTILYTETKQECELLLNKLITAKFLNTNQSPYGLQTKKRIIKRASQQLIETINNKINPMPQAQIACVLYGPNNCPQQPHRTSNVESSGSSGISVIESVLDDSLSRKFKCQIQEANKGTNLCVNKSNNKYNTTDCEIMNGYGELMCDNTLHNSNSNCIYEPLSQRCLNPVESNGAIEVDSNNKLNNASQCHLVYSNDIEEMRTLCENNTNENCSFKEFTDLNNKKQGICYANDENARPSNFCLSFSNSNSNLNNNELGELGCKKVNRIINGNNVVYSMSSDKVMNDLDCQLFDSSKKKYNLAGIRSDKNPNESAFINDPLNQKQLCNGLLQNNGTKKCQYLEYNRYIPSDHDSKYSKLGICIPNQVSLNLKSDLIDNENKCSNGLIWSSINNKCINPNANCQDIKYKNVCNYHDACLWQSGSLETDESQDYESGFCRDLTPSLDRIEDLLDNIHERNLKSSVEVNSIEEKLTKLMPTIKRVMASNENN